MPGWVLTQRQISLWLDDAGEQAMDANHSTSGCIVGVDIVHIAMFLAADPARMITAQQFVLDAGWSLEDPRVSLAPRRRLMGAKVPGSPRYHH